MKPGVAAFFSTRQISENRRGGGSHKFFPIPYSLLKKMCLLSKVVASTTKSSHHFMHDITYNRVVHFKWSPGHLLRKMNG